MASSGRSFRGVAAPLVMLAGVLLAPPPGTAHPLGNFSISHYAGIRVSSEGIELRYLIDMAEIPTFQEIQETGLVPEDGHPGLKKYLARQAEALKAGLRLELNGRRLPLRSEATEVIFPPGAGGLPTMKVGVLYRVRLDPAAAALSHLGYRDENYPGRAGWKEIVATGGSGIALVTSSVPDTDRSRQLADYPTDLLSSPPQDLEAHLTFTVAGSPPAVAGTGAAVSPVRKSRSEGGARQPRADRASSPSSGAAATPEPMMTPVPAPAEATSAAEVAPIRLQARQQATPRNAFTELVATKELSLGIVFLALAVAAGLGAFHALEPGHGKTVVAAYLVGSRGTAWHALILGLIVTASHTAGVYLLGAVTLYASRFVVPERLYPWLGALSGLIIAGLGFILFVRRYVGEAHPHAHAHNAHDHGLVPIGKSPGSASGRGSWRRLAPLARRLVTRPAPAAPFGCGRRPKGSHCACALGSGVRRHPRPGPPPRIRRSGLVPHSHGPGGAADHTHRQHPPHAHGPDRTVSLRELFALGVTGGIVPCPAALVVLLSALALRRVGFGLLLIVAFSVGLAVVLIAIGLLMVYARRFMSRVHGERPLITRWLPLSSAAVITLLGAAIAVQALLAAGILQVKL